MKVYVAVGIFAAVLSGPCVAQRPRIDPAPLATYTGEQASQGKTLYAQQCGNCHGKNLSGSEFATPLNGTAFSLNWGGKPADQLFPFIRTRMPPTAVGSLSPDATAALVAYILQVNGAKATDAPFATDATTLAALRVPRNPAARASPMMP